MIEILNTLTEQQEEARDNIVMWYENLTSYDVTEDYFKNHQVFAFCGLAGSGKSYLISVLTKYYLKLNMSDIVFITPTAKAASVLIGEGLLASTVHMFLYVCDTKSKNVIVNGEVKVVQEIKFKKKKFTKANRPKLIILDEASMVSEEMMEDIKSVGSPILAVGDPGQLPPVNAKQNIEINNANYTLTDIVRQAKGNPIISIAREFRDAKYVKYGEYKSDSGYVKILNRHTMNIKEFTEIIMNSEQVLCGKNSTKNTLNRFIRKQLNKSSICEDGDKVICVQNNYEIPIGDKYMLSNGMQGTIRNFKIVDEKLGLCTFDFCPDFLDKNDECNWKSEIISELAPFIGEDYRYLPRSKIYIDCDGKYSVSNIVKKADGESKEDFFKRVKPELEKKKNAVITTGLNRFEFGYCISVHKSQGSTYNNTVIVDESSIFGADKYKWLYVAITRAKKYAILLR